jgi:mandelate racemase
VEEPTRPDDFAGHARIAAECRTPIQLGENLWEPHHLTKSLSVGASDFVMLDVMKIGGITGGCARLPDTIRTHKDWLFLGY